MSIWSRAFVVSRCEIAFSVLVMVGVLGDLGIEVVHQHPHGRFLRPAPAGQGGAARGTDRARAGWVGGRHRWLLVEWAARQTQQVAGWRAGRRHRRPGSSCLISL